MTVISAKLLLPNVFGVLMVGAAGHRASSPALILTAAALAAVLVAGWLRPVATVAVLLTVFTVVPADPAPM
ncbi:MAG: hypothetical protein V3U55_04925, partial [Mycobacterium sp.]